MQYLDVAATRLEVIFGAASSAGRSGNRGGSDGGTGISTRGWIMGWLISRRNPRT